ncbi:MAG: hypothetical protein IPK26_06810 [Planctomycetes bacterium]|nr:hypothetical protein [Planctomycetota bacterium]
MRVPLLLFLFGLLLRLLFWQATTDRDHVFATAFVGDAPIWQAQAADLARAAQDGKPPSLGELQLPLRPPGMTWLVASLWDGAAATAWRLRLLFVFLGAAIAPLLWLLLSRSFARPVATFAATICAASTSLMLLGSGPHNELPYLLLFLVSMFDYERLRRAAGAWPLLRWSVLQALLCLLRTEHLLTFVGLLALALRRQPARVRAAAIALAAFGATLLPWQVAAWRQIDHYNRHVGQPLPPPGTPLPARYLQWDDAALARVRELPACQQTAVFCFVGDTIRTRGGTRVTTDDLRVVEEAYGWWPRPLPRGGLALYGPLNFFLGNAKESDSGFSTTPLLRPPQLLGGPERYPPGMVLPQQLALSYPPHLRAVIDGYALGLAELTADVPAALLRIGKKLVHGWQGAATGLGGYNLPNGLSGTRRPVDFVVAEHLGASLWRLLIGALTLAGLLLLARHPAGGPWLCWAITKVIPIAAFFGYARQGALVVPVVALAAALAWDRWLRPRCTPRAWQRIGLALGTGLLLVETVRVFATEGITIEERPIAAATAEPPATHHVRCRIGY